MNIFRRAIAPISLGLLALTVLAGCQVGFSAGRTRYYSDRVWYGDPYCRYSWDYGCGYSNGDSFRVRFIYGNRHSRRHRGHRGWHNVSASTTMAAGRPTSWKQEFRLSDRAISKIKGAFDAALAGDTSKLTSLGVAQSDLSRLGNFQMPSKTSLARAARSLGMSQADLRDFVELYLIRLKTALASNQQ